LSALAQIRNGYFRRILPALRNVGLGQSTADRATPWVTWLDGELLSGAGDRPFQPVAEIRQSSAWGSLPRSSRFAGVLLPKWNFNPETAIVIPANWQHLILDLRNEDGGNRANGQQAGT
jgi:hypothetical protein